MLVAINSFLVVSLGILHFIDMFTTMYIVYGGYGKEANPVLIPALEAGPLAFILVKLFCMFIMIACFWALRVKHWATYIYLAMIYMVAKALSVHFEVISNIP